MSLGRPALASNVFFDSLLFLEHMGPNITDILKLCHELPGNVRGLRAYVFQEASEIGINATRWAARIRGQWQ